MRLNEWLWEITNSQTNISYIRCGRKIIYVTLKKIDPVIYISDYRGKPERFLKVLRYTTNAKITYMVYTPEHFKQTIIKNQETFSLNSCP